MKKIFGWTLLVIFLMVLALAVRGQDTNIHGAYGTKQDITIGGDLQKHNKLLEFEADRFKICKDIGGCGHQIDLKALYGLRISKTAYLEGGVVNSHYRVPMFSKNSLQMVVGGRKEFEKRLIGEISYRHDLTSPNRVRMLDARFIAYLPHHIYIREVFKLSHYKANNRMYTDPSWLFSAGFYL